jgi:hypothetical protein
MIRMFVRLHIPIRMNCTLVIGRIMPPQRGIFALQLNSDHRLLHTNDMTHKCDSFM